MFTVAIIGRPNVGKSTLFNKLAGKALALVHDTPGVTRDWKAANADLNGMTLRIIDTAGLEDVFDESIAGKMRSKTEEALAQANLAVLVMDARASVLPLDQHFAKWIRKRNIPVLLVANKAESKRGQVGFYDAYSLGLGEPIMMSAEHGIGFSDLAEAIRPYYDQYQSQNEPDNPDQEDDHDPSTSQYNEGDETGFGDEDFEDDETKPIKIAIVGRPNVGKSTLMNALLGEDRVMTGPEPGVTRDAIAVDWTYADRPFRLVDTAGMRKKAKVHETLEKLSVEDSLRAIRLAQVVVLVLDADHVLDKQDLQIADLIVREGRAFVIAVNKWDAAKDKTESLERLQDKLEYSLAQTRDVPTVTISALKQHGLEALMQTVMRAYAVWNTRVPTGKLNRWLKGMEAAHPPPLTTQKRAQRLRYITQIKARPPTFALWCSKPRDLPESYKRYLTKGLRQSFNIPGTPVRLLARTSKNPYQD